MAQLYCKLIHRIVAGGFNKDKQVLNNVMRYEPLLDKWVKVANMNTPRARHGNDNNNINCNSNICVRQS